MNEIKDAEFYDNTFYGRLSYKLKEFKKLCKKLAIILVAGATIFVIGRASVLNANHNDFEIQNCTNETQQRIPVYNQDYRDIPEDINDGY